MATIHDRHIALLIAHPDDEVMFFSPTIMALTKPELGNTLQVICFSSGKGLQDPPAHRFQHSVDNKYG